MRHLHTARKYSKDNKKFLDIVSYYLAKREYETVERVLGGISHYTQDSLMHRKVRNLFINDKRAKEYFGLAETIVGSTSNMIFAGNVNIKVENPKAQELIDELYFDGYLLETLKELYKDAISMADKAVSYLFFNTIQEYNNVTQVKIKDKFVNLESVAGFHVEKHKNTLKRKYYKTIYLNSDQEEVREYIYNYIVNEDMTTDLYIEGFDGEGNKLEDRVVKEDLAIDMLYERFDFVPFLELNIGQGMLPNILWIENSLVEALYFQDEDLPNSQTTTYIPESQLFEETQGNFKHTFEDKYSTKKILSGTNIDAVEMVTHVEGKSAISTIEKNIALNVLQGCLDAKISPVSLGYSLIDKIASNTDVGVEKERVSIRKRENDVNTLKVFISKAVQLYLELNDIYMDESEIAVIFDQYITPSVESMTNTLSKQVQFGIKSRELAVRELNKNELSDNEIKEEYERIKELGTQIDYNVEQREQKEEDEEDQEDEDLHKKGTKEDKIMNKAKSNILKSEK